MRIIPALIGASLGVGIATTVIAQTTTPPAPAINPGTKVYAYEKTAPPPKAKMTAPMQQRIDDEAPIGSQKWWNDQNRRSLGNSGDGGGSGM
jgi:hypothetical protein